MIDRDFIYVNRGTKIRPAVQNLTEYNYEFYTLIRPRQYIYSYDYEPEEKWITRAPEYDPDRVLTGEYELTAEALPSDGEGYIVFKDSVTGESLNRSLFVIQPAGYDTTEEAEKASIDSKVSAFMERDDVREEISRTADTIHRTCVKPTQLTLGLIADTHYVINGNWEYTRATFEAVSNAPVTYDGVIHLGDFTDGMLSRERCRTYSGRVLDSMRSWGLPMVIALGNHDANYFRGNPAIMNESEQRDMYLSDMHPDRAFYRCDIEAREAELTLLVLSAYENSEADRYGFTTEQLDWISEELNSLPEGRRVLILSHDAPLARLDFWAKEIRNGEALCDILDRWNCNHDYRIAGFLHGHTHADMIWTGRSFPIISVGCSKIEYFEDKKPDGAVCPIRIEGEVSQELWDSLIIDTATGDIDLIRFGAGADRHVNGTGSSRRDVACGDDATGGTCHYTISAPVVWGHRGASGYLPENTLEAFKLAADMGADGIELDVQFTRDRELVVIHDETIDRTSDGQGAVASKTLEELRQYNYNKTHPDDRHYDIPTLAEVLELVRPTRMCINIELKTGVNPYPGIEAAVVDLVRKYGMEDRVIYSSFNHESLLRVKAVDPSAECGVLYSAGIANAAGYASGLGLQAIHPSVGCVKSPGLRDRSRDLGIRIHTWTVNTEAQIEQMLQYGVDAVITNYPDVALKLYGREYRDYSQVIESGGANRSLASDASSVRKHSVPVHALGVMYSYIRKPFVAIDRFVQRLSGR